MTCDNSAEIVEQRIDRVLTQYRESPKLLFLLRTYLSEIIETNLNLCDLPSIFDIDSALGDQLTILGKRLGWPRCHCVCDASPVVGFDCPDELTIRPIVGFGIKVPQQVIGFCEDTTGFNEPVLPFWNNCPPDDPDYTNCADNATWEICASGLSETCIDDDDTYRKFLKVRRWQMMGMFDLESLELSLKTFFGETARVLHSGQGRVVLSPGRDLTITEISLLQLYPRVLPIALGIETRFHFNDTHVAGFGSGWGGFCEPQITSNDDHSDYAGFGSGWGGFCEPTSISGVNITTQSGVNVYTESDKELITTPLLDNSSWVCIQGAQWMCETDVQPYSC